MGITNTIQTAPGRWRFPTTFVITSESVAVGKCGFVPIETPAQSWNGVGLNIWTAEAGVTIELGLYGDNGGYPGDKLFSVVVDASTAGMKIIDVTPVAVPAGLVWSAVLVVGGAGALRIASVGHTNNALDLVSINHVAPYGGNITVYNGGLFSNSGFSTLPATAPTGMGWSRWVPFASIRGAR